nr:RPA-related protein RADX-like isoform X2 [Paramormyrops kingsleyae]
MLRNVFVVAKMAAAVSSRPGCFFQRTLSSLGNAPSHSEFTRTCREPLYLISIDRYIKDLTFGIHFPQAVNSSENLYDATVSDGDCKLRVTIHPSLNSLVESNTLRCGCQLRNVTFSVGGERKSQKGGCHTYGVVNLTVDSEAGEDAALDALCGIDIDALPWFGSDGDGPCLLPLRAQRSSYLPLWNNQDYNGEMWRDGPPGSASNTDSDTEEDMEDLHPTVTIQKIRRSFRSRSRVAKGVLLVRILRKSRLVYYGKSERNCECAYKTVLEVADRTGLASVVLWNTLCIEWYRSLHPGQLLRLSQYRVKESYLSRMGESQEADIEISVNSRNPTAHISVIPQTEDFPQLLLPDISYSFYCGIDLLNCSTGATCDVIGLVVFVGRPERIKSKESQGAELWEYRWLQLEDGTTDFPIVIQLFSTSQPEIHCRIHPMSIVVCTNMQLVKTAPDRLSSFQYLTSTTFTQVYCTGSGHHSAMPYRRLRPVRRFIQWAQTVDESRLLGRVVVGGFFTYPPLPVSLEQFLKSKKGEPALVSGAELRREAERLQYREMRRFAVQATITAVSHSGTGGTTSLLAVSDSAASPSVCSQLDHSGAVPDPATQWIPVIPGCSGTYPEPNSPQTSVKLSPRSPRLRARSGSVQNGSAAKTKLFGSMEPPRKRLALPLRPTEESNTEEEADIDYTLWDASMEFLEKEDDEEDEADEEQAGSVGIVHPDPVGLHTSQCPTLGVALAPRETVPRQFHPQRREVQMAAAGLQPGRLQDTLPCGKLDTFAPSAFYSGHYTLALRALTDSVSVNALFLPASPGNLHWCPYPQPHSNSWEDILSHGGFSPSSPPPAPSDLVATATELTSKRLLCVLEVCQLGRARLEVVLTRAFATCGSGR